jgi:quercetin dioxygenase-like cupin family protein
MSQIRLQPWTEPTLPSEQEAEAKLHQEGYESFIWNDVPGSTYPRHQHSYDECLWVLKGQITFTIDDQDYPLKPGDRLYLPARLPHTAKVSAQAGVTYLVGQKRK